MGAFRDPTARLLPCERARPGGALSTLLPPVQLAVRHPTSTTLAPFGDAVATLPVLGRSLASCQDEAIEQAGLTLVDTPPNGPHFAFSDRTWFTAELVRRVCAGPVGRLHIDDPDFWAATGSLQDAPLDGVFEIALHPGAGSAAADLDGLRALPLAVVDCGLRDYDIPPLPPSMAHAARPIRVGAAMAHQVRHWTHLVRLNQLALAAVAEQARLDFENASALGKLWRGARFMARARSIQPARIMASLNEIGEGAQIHPSAVVEASHVGAGAVIGANAVVRASVLGPGVRIEEHATVAMSSLGDCSHVGRYGFVNLCTLFPGARVSSGGGYQVSVFGRDSFMAWGATGLDMSFGGPVRVLLDGALVDTGHHFIGVAIGHDAVVGNGVRVHHGMEVPNGAFVVADADGLLRHWNDAPTDGQPVVVRGGRAHPLQRKDG